MGFRPVRSVILSVISLAAFSNILQCDGQFFQFRNFETFSSTPLPFPTCRIDNIECLRRGLRTFFFLMETGHLGMKPIDPIILNSVTVAIPSEQMSFLMRRVNVTGAKWTTLVDRKFNLPGGKNGVQFRSNLHVTGEITMSMAARTDPYIAHITMDLYHRGISSIESALKLEAAIHIDEVESNITYVMSGQRGIDNEDYILIGPERIAVRNSRTPTFFLQPALTEDSYMIEQVLLARQPILDHLSNEITIAVMHYIVDNFRQFALSVPVRKYYTYNK